VAKVGYAILALAVTLPAFLYAVDWGGVELPFLAPSPTEPPSLALLGTPAPPPEVTLDPAALFAAPEGADPLSPALWQPATQLLAAAGTPAGWTALCRAFGSAAGVERAAAPLTGALACSADPSLLPVQRLAALVLEAKAQLVLWLRAAPGSSSAAVAARQAAIRGACTVLPEARSDGGPAAEACRSALDTSYLEGDPARTLSQLDAAYAALADLIAARDPTIAPEPAFPATP
jgi:hypothetical protein